MTVYNYDQSFLLPLSVPRMTNETTSSSFLTLALHFFSFFHQGDTIVDAMSDGAAHIDKSDLPSTNKPLILQPKI